ncbi:hypothetical protein Nepgr_019956 [Nepenthes gracilis]|uniref:Uncharacterized protein n=1 Tax=Nepenthes gracilis TaxID=150966 RepID=A0AAD3SVX7_NEPGR|nr:hypothetical protein Nepgr_019956 [Nepenthes gracilis]
MDGREESKVTGICQIGMLKELLQKWQAVTLNSRAHDDSAHQTSPPGGISPDFSWRSKNSLVPCDSDEEDCQTPEPPPDVPKGYLAVYVGEELRRFIIPTSYLSHHLFTLLLAKAEEEYGFDHNGALTIPCETETFKYLLKCIEIQQNADSHNGTHDNSAEESSSTED